MNNGGNIFAAPTARKGSFSKAKKLIAYTLAVLMAFCFMPAMAWQGGDNVAYALLPDDEGNYPVPDAYNNPYDVNSLAYTAYEELYKESGVADHVSSSAVRYNTLKETDWAKDPDNASTVEDLAEQVDNLTTSFSAILTVIGDLAEWTKADQTAWETYQDALDALDDLGLLDEDGNLDTDAADEELAKYDAGAMSVSANAATGVYPKKKRFNYTLSGGGEYWRSLLGIGIDVSSYSIEVSSYTGDNDLSWNGARTISDKWYPYFVYQETEDSTLLNTSLTFSNLSWTNIALTSYQGFLDLETSLQNNIDIVEDVDPDLIEKQGDFEDAKDAKDSLIGAAAKGDEPATGIWGFIADLNVMLGNAEDEAGTAHFTLSLTSDDGTPDNISLYYDKGKDAADQQKKSYTFVPASEENLSSGIDYTVTYEVVNAASVAEFIQCDIVDDTITLTPKKHTANDLTLSVKADFTVKNSAYNALAPVVDPNPLSIKVNVTNKLTFDTSEITVPIGITKDAYQNQTIVVSASGGRDVTYASTLAEGSVDETHGRITFGGDTFTIGKDANTGTYSYDVVATDAKGQTAEQTVTFVVTNAYDAEFAWRRAELEEIQKQIKDLLDAMALLPSDQVDPNYLAILNAFSTIISPYDAMWNNGNPAITQETMYNLADQIEALSADDAEIGWMVTAIRGIGDLIEVEVNLGIFGTFKVSDYLKSDKQSVIDGYHITIISGLWEQDVPSIPGLYYEAVTTAWGTFQKEISPLTALMDAYEDLETFVVDTDYAGLTSVEAVNGYVQTLYVKYAALDAALAAFNESEGFVRDIAAGILDNANELIAAAVGVQGDAGRLALEALIQPLIDEYITDATLNEWVSGLVTDAFDAVFGVVSDVANGLPEVPSLNEIVGYSAQLRTALAGLAETSALVAGTVQWGKDFDLADYDLAKIDMLDDYLLQIYEDYLTAVTGSANAAEIVESLRAKIEDLRARLEGNPTFQEVAAIYKEISSIYTTVTAAIDYFSSDRPEQDFEAVKAAFIQTLEEIRDLALSGQTTGADLQADIEKRINVLIAILENAPISELAFPDTETYKLLEGALDELGEFLGGIAGVDFAGPYDEAKAAFKEAMRVIATIYNVYQFVERIMAYVESGALERDIIDYINRLVEKAITEITAEINAQIAIIDAIIRAVPNPEITSSGDIFRSTTGAITFSTDVGWLLDVLYEYAGVPYPTYTVVSAMNADGGNAAGLFEISDDNKLKLNGAGPLDNGAYTVHVSLVFGTGNTTIDGKLNALFDTYSAKVSVDLPLEKAELRKAITDAKTEMNNAASSIAAITKVIDKATETAEGYPSDIEDALKAEIDALQAALDDVIASRSALDDAREGGIDALADADEQKDLNTAVEEINDKQTKLKAALENLANAKAALETALEGIKTTFIKLTPVVDESDVEVWMYDDGVLPSAPTVSAIDPIDNSEVAGSSSWENAVVPTESGTKAAIFTPDYTKKYTKVSFSVTVHVLTKAALDDEIVYAEALLKWLEDDKLTGAVKGQISSAAIDALELALNGGVNEDGDTVVGAKEIAGKAANVNNQVDINAAYAKLKAAIDAMTPIEVDHAALFNAVEAAQKFSKVTAVTLSAIDAKVRYVQETIGNYPSYVRDEILATIGAITAAAFDVAEAKEAVDVFCSTTFPFILLNASQENLDNCLTLIEGAMADLAEALAILEEFEAALDELTGDEYPKKDVTVTTPVYYIYEGDTVPGNLDKDDSVIIHDSEDDSVEVAGYLKWQSESGDEFHPRAEGWHVYQFIPPEANLDYYKISDDWYVQIIEVDKSGLETKIAYADSLLDWISSSALEGDGKGQIPSTSVGALETAIAAAIKVTETKASASSAGDIAEALEALNAAIADVIPADPKLQPLVEAITDAYAGISGANATVAAISGTIERALSEGYPEDTQALKDAQKARDTVNTSMAALKAAIEKGEGVLATDNPTSGAITNAKEAIAKATAELAEAIVEFEGAIVALESLLGEAKITPRASTNEVIWIYDNATALAAPPQVTALDDGKKVSGASIWKEGDIPKTSVSKAAVFTPKENLRYKYGTATFEVLVNVVSRLALDSAIADARYILDLIKAGGWVEKGTVSQASFDALNKAFTDATAVSAKDASAGAGAEINGALTVLNSALGVVAEDLSEVVTITLPSNAAGTEIQRSNVPVTTVNSKLSVTFNAKGGVFTVDGRKVGVNSIEVEPGQKLGDLPKPTRENFRFAGWFYAGQKGATKVAPGVTITSQLTLQASWDRIAYVKKAKTKIITKALPKQKVKNLKKGKKVYVIGKSGKYYNVQYGKTKGWVLKKGLVLQSTKYAKKTTWVKKKASAKAKKLAKVGKNGKFTVIGVNGKYYQVKFVKGGKTLKGFVLKKDLKKKAPVAAGAAA
jgi:hypothetical protein